MVRRKAGSYPVDRNDGDQVYFDTGTAYSDMGLASATTYYYCAWSEVTGSQQWSDDHAESYAATLAPAADGNNQMFNGDFAGGTTGGFTIPTPPKVLVPQVNVRSPRIQVGQAAVIYANVVNRGEMSGSYKVELKIDSEVVETREGTISGNKAIPLEFTVYRDKPGEYEVEINGQKAFFTVVEQDSRTSVWGLYLMGCILCIVGAALSMAVILRRRLRY